MSYAIVSVIYGVPKNQDVAEKIEEWEKKNDERWEEGNGTTCGFENLYSASGPSNGYCGVWLSDLGSYQSELVSSIRMVPTEKEKQKAQAMVDALDPELKKLAGPIGVYFIWSDA